MLIFYIDIYIYILMNKIIDNLILFLHIIFIIIAIVIPFTNSNYFLMMYAITIPFILMHWICQDNTCMVTLVEKYLRKKYNYDNEDCITCKLIEPVYDFPKKYTKYNTLIYLIAGILLSLAIFKLSYKYYNGYIKNVKDLFVI